MLTLLQVQNVESFTVAKWETQIQLAKDAHIDGFALNIVYPWDPLMTQLSYAFTAANNKGFKMIFSLDYAASDPELGWPKDKVIELINIYGPNGAYFKHSTGQPLVSTFEGPSWYRDWVDIKSSTNAFFVPSYSSLGARRAMTTGVAVSCSLIPSDINSLTLMLSRTGCSTGELGLKARIT